MVDSSQQEGGIRSSEHWCRAERLYWMKCAFVAGASFTVGELAERFGVVETTIMRDLNVLSTKLGVPLVCEVRWHMMAEECAL